VPHITSCFTLQPEGRQSLKPVTLPSGRDIDPTVDDLLLELAIDRLVSRPQHDAGAKVTISAACFGLLCHINVKPPGTAERLLVVDQAGAEHRVRIDPSEQPGRWFDPSIAAAVTATAQLLLMCARLLVERAGGTVAYWDTDSLIIVATPDGGLIRCPGGPHRLPDGDEAIPSLSYSQVDQVRSEMELVSPYPPDVSPGQPTLLGIEPENFEKHGRRRPLYLWSTASKNYDLFTSGDDDAIELIKRSEHGLGHLQPPDADSDFITTGKTYLLRQDLGLHTNRPDWWVEWALSVITLTQPHELAVAQAAEDTYSAAIGRSPARVRPYTRLAIAHPIPQYAHREGGGRVTPVAPYHDGFDPRTAQWRDLYTGQLLQPRAVTRRLTESDLHDAKGRVLVKTLGAAFLGNHRRHDPTMTTSIGEGCTAATSGIIAEQPTEAYRVELISKETRNLDRAGITEDPAYTSLLDPFEVAWRDNFLPALRILAPDTLKPGRPSRKQRQAIAHVAGKLATAAIDGSGAARVPRVDGEAACYRYLQTRTSGIGSR
jgi:hypothetical protein